MPIGGGCCAWTPADTKRTAAASARLSILLGRLRQMPDRRLLAFAQALALLVDELAGHRDRGAVLHVDQLPVDQRAVPEALLSPGEVELPHAVEGLVVHLDDLVLVHDGAVVPFLERVAVVEAHRLDFHDLEAGLFAFLDQLAERRDVAAREDVLARPLVGEARSEERRVGKECRARWSPYH